MCRGLPCKDAPGSDAGGSQLGGRGAPPASPSPSPSPPQSPVSILLPASTPGEEVPDDLWVGNGDSSADFTGEEFRDNKENVMALINEFDQENGVIMKKIKLLSQKYKYFRPIERDGNCFYRAFIFSYLDHAFEIEDESERSIEVTHLRQCVEKAKQAYGSLESFDAFEYVINLIEAGLSSEQLYLADIKEHIILSILPSLRLLTEIELCTQEEFYNPFLSSLEEYESVDEFCQYEVSPMGTEANHLQITALVNALGIPLVLENLDTSLSYGFVQVNQHTFCPRPDAEHIEERTLANLTAAERRRLVTLLYRPGHYDILYPK